MERPNQKQTYLCLIQYHIKKIPLNFTLELNIVVIRSRCFQMTSFSTAPRCRCLFVVLILFTSGTWEDSLAWVIEWYRVSSALPLDGPCLIQMSSSAICRPREYTSGRPDLLLGKIGVSVRGESCFPVLHISFLMEVGRG